MITGEIKNKIDQIWDTFFVAGVTNPIKSETEYIKGYSELVKMLEEA